jgi:hypothetical protein
MLRSTWRGEGHSQCRISRGLSGCSGKRNLDPWIALGERVHDELVATLNLIPGLLADDQPAGKAR